jgi:hypothetical protein
VQRELDGQDAWIGRMGGECGSMGYFRVIENACLGSVPWSRGSGRCRVMKGKRVVLMRGSIDGVVT